MAGLHDSDIRLDANWQPAAAANGEALLVTDYDCLFQDIRLEALTQEGELFYDESWGWSLLEFIQSQDDELTRLEIEQRVKEKLERRIEIDADTIQVITAFRGDAITVHASFRFRGDERLYELDVDLDRVKVEVVLVD
ncbi:DUF2634 domain-containing protein [Paenibacillus melissococcoides]|uniref:DUF2634 domain-containing protein n=1 Tax=Paenibacillus melissococcoides TaxID=2912268 RepID=A0ABM9G7N0_9BACL|nr:MULTISPECIES: DUF2634 domain-containing protein [Paenibacillus]MEB9894800.1 DUF2634 domain-containing protein [Bacillus cereus]CAH8247744.1 DUF2634 domain-containing protein [Paenibacillus melissococcoides]CAH8248811.1 DUF2634 domain-containing protein [Paenibacillus melissococcoides]CAH8248836.1 DUF2634 domain-containing protein [Paenibacillus melissococcoides]CAH8248987.1 DUF2634 domain-containing protein [Paenibacillus melissococcoides]